MGFLHEWDIARKRILCQLIIDKLASILFKRKESQLAKRFALIIIFLHFEILQLSIMVISRRPLTPVLGVSFIVSIIGSLCIYSISWSYKFAREEIEVAINRLPIGERADKRLIDWSRRWANIRHQLLVSIGFTLMVLSLLYIINNNSGLVYYPSDIVTFVVPITFWGCQGLYWGIATPLMTRALLDGNKLLIKTNPVFPNRTPILLALSNMLTSFSAWIAILITLSVITLFMLKSQVKGNSYIYGLTLILIGYITSGWTFVYPQFILAQIVMLSKQKSLSQIESEISKTYSKFENLNKAEFERINYLIELHKKISDNPNTLINLSVFRSYVGTLIAPALVGLLGSFDLTKLIEEIKSLFR